MKAKKPTDYVENFKKRLSDNQWTIVAVETVDDTVRLGLVGNIGKVSFDLISAYTAPSGGTTRAGGKTIRFKDILDLREDITEEPHLTGGIKKYKLTLAN